MIQGRFPLISLGDITSLDIDKVTVDPSKSYAMVGVYSFGKGLFKKETVDGASTSYKYFNRLRSHHIVMSQLFGWEGALALCQPEFVDRFVSPQFPTFACDDTKLDREFLGWLLRFPPMWAELGTMTKGMGDRRRTLNPDAFFAVKIPLPPLDEQRQIVTRIKNIAAKVEEAKKIRCEIDSKTKAVGASILFGEGAKAYERVPLKDLLSLRPPDIEVSPSNSYAFAGVYCFGRGLFKSGLKSGQDTAYKRLTRLRAGDFTYPKLMAWEGALGVVPPELDGCVVSPEFPVFELDQARILPEVIDTYFRSASVWPEVAAMSKGTNVRRRRVHPSAFLEYKFPLPPMHIQKQLRAIRENSAKLSAERIKIDSKLDALLPSILDKAFRGELNIAEIEHRPAKVVPIQRKNTASEAFQEAVLIARLVRDFSSDEYLLSRKRYTKLAYLFHRKSKDDVKRRYLKKAAGPYSPWTKYQGPEKIALTNQYIQKGKKQKYSGFKPGPEIDQIDRYFTTYWDDGNIAWLIERFKYKSTNNLEVLATVDMAMLDLVDQARVVSLETVKDVIASEPEWVPKLSRKIFSDTAIAEAIRELQGWFIYN